MFNESAANVAECARRLRDVLADPASRHSTEAIEKVIECERRGDVIVRGILHRLDKTFVTPFDREDIHALAEELDDVVDDMLTVTHLLQASRPTSSLPELKEAADVLVQTADEVVVLMSHLENMKGVQEHLDAVDRLESEGDAIYRRILSRLFSGEFDALEVLRWKDTIEALEAALNTLEDVSNVVESIVFKHA
jgi:predicted phosphate transport protein (TIGR00153 family)